MSDFLLEIGCEEIPARFMPKLLADLRDQIEAGLADHRIAFDSVSTLGTYRRLVVKVSNIALTQSDEDKWIKGPPAQMAKDDSGNWTPAAAGFAKKNGITPDQLHTKEEGGREFLFAHVQTKGGDTRDHLPELVNTAVKALYLPVAMRWGDGDDTFVRPIHWVLALMDSTTVALTIMGTESGNLTYGHRVLSHESTAPNALLGKQAIVPSVSEYENTLKTLRVDVDPSRRRETIVSALTKTISKEDIDDALLEEVVYLVEWPEVLSGTFDPEFLSVPQSVLIECMGKHQKFFPVIKDGELQNQFLLAADSVKDANRDTVIKGNENVLRARLEDAKFFWTEDLKTPLDDKVSKLKAIVYQEGLGSIYDKKERIKHLSAWLTDTLGVPDKAADIQQTAELCKADLVTQMVYEFPDLQGEMGSLYAKKSGHSDEVSKGIAEHYLPKGAHSPLPQSLTGQIVGIADRIDTIVACFHNGYNPTGSKDPLGVRRAVYGVLKVMIECKQAINLSVLLDEAFTAFKDAKNTDKATAYLVDRIRTFLIEDAGLDSDIVDAVLSKSLESLMDAVAAGRVLQEYRQDDAFKTVVDAGVRVSRLAEKADPNVPISNDLIEVAQEKALVDLLSQLETKAFQDAAQLYDCLSRDVTPVITDYFDSVMVMAENPRVKANRLATLLKADRLFKRLGNFEKLQV